MTRIDWSKVPAIPIPKDRRFKDLRGRKFCRLTPYELVAPRTWRCRCDCGAVAIAVTHHLLSGEQKSCGCYARERLIERCTTHGLTNTPEFIAWKSMRSRCSNPKRKDFARYGGRGIRVCERWDRGDGVKSGFECFLEDMGPKPSPRYSLDRLDNDLNYDPQNCHWALPVQQTRNRSNTRLVEYNGETMPIARACELAGIDYMLAMNRIYKGMSPDRVFDSRDLRRAGS